MSQPDDLFDDPSVFDDLDRLEAGVWPIKRKQLADQIDRCERDGKPAVFLRSRIEYLDNLYGHREH